MLVKMRAGEKCSKPDIKEDTVDQNMTSGYAVSGDIERGTCGWREIRMN